VTSEEIELGVSARQSAAKLVSRPVLVGAGRETQSRLLFDEGTGWSVVVTLSFCSQAARGINVQIVFHRWMVSFKMSESLKCEVD
jgi:hypothetical protein